MAKFIFKMDNILSIKEKLEDQAKAEYGMELVKLREEEEKKLRLEAQKIGYEEKLTQALQDYLEMQKIRRLENAIEVMKFQIKLQQHVIAQQEARVAKAKALSETSYYQKEIDELVSFRHGNGIESEG